MIDGIKIRPKENVGTTKDIQKMLLMSNDDIGSQNKGDCSVLPRLEEAL